MIAIVGLFLAPATTIVTSYLLNRSNRLTNMETRTMFGGRIDTLEKKLNAVESQLGKKIELVESKLDEKIELVESKLGGKIELVESKLDEKIELVESKLGGKIELAESKLGGKIELAESKLGNGVKVVDMKVHHQGMFFARTLGGTDSVLRELCKRENLAMPKTAFSASDVISQIQA